MKDSDLDEINRLEMSRPVARRITPEERRLIDEAIAAGRVTYLPMGASAFSRDYQWQRDRRGAMVLRTAGDRADRRPGYAWRREIGEEGRLAGARGRMQGK